jgi:meiotically up-regulated gene 157 (Mug157) protein
MNLQHEKIDSLCEKLQLLGICHNYLKISDESAKEESTYTSFLEKILEAEWKTRQKRRQTTLTR